MRNFRNLKIWQAGIQLVKNIYDLTSEFPNNEKHGLSSQMQRAAISIPSNIAEGCSRNSQVEYKRFLEIAMGSAFEVETQLIIAKEINLIKIDDLNSTINQLHSLQKQINALISAVKKDQKPITKG